MMMKPSQSWLQFKQLQINLEKNILGFNGFEHVASVVHCNANFTVILILCFKLNSSIYFSQHHMNNEGIASPALRRSQLAAAMSKREIPATEAPYEPCNDLGPTCASYITRPCSRHERSVASLLYLAVWLTRANDEILFASAWFSTEVAGSTRETARQILSTNARNLARFEGKSVACYWYAVILLYMMYVSWACPNYKPLPP